MVSRLHAVTVLAVILFAPLSALDAQAFRIIATSSGAAGIAQAPCCSTGFDGGSTSRPRQSTPVPRSCPMW